ncbi:hypothetical protein [Acidicapsa ligni]|uniref:hypothetical protein n=1 Tax=Acidicapsa ligni TaxID=542300 RepID=UPI0021E0561F|nr:hypothetical protein [Acidicapsa ligni]
MHIHSGQISPSQTNSAHASTAATAARQSEATRKKLFASASELDATASTETSWMVTAWAGKDSSANQGYYGSNESGDQDQATETQRTSSAAPVSGPLSFWA